MDLKFKAKIINNRYNSEDYKIYVVDVDDNIYKNIKANKNGEYILVGNIPDLVPDIEYDVVACADINKKFGVQYKVRNIKRDKPTNKETAFRFLKEILTLSQAESLLSKYPNIIDKIIKNDLDDIDLSDVKGIKEKTFLKIKEKVVSNFCLIELVDKFGGLIEISIMKKLYDKYSSVKIVENKLKENPYKCLCGLSRIGFKTADDILLNCEKLNLESPNKYKFKFDFKLKHSEQRMKACLCYVLEENENKGNTRMSIKDARVSCGKLVPECIDLFVDVLKSNDKDFNINMDKKMISLTRTYNLEFNISTFVKEMNDNAIIWNIKSELYREVDGMNMTDEQLNVIDMMCNNNIGILTAPAGSGKSSGIKALINMLEDNNKSYILMTPTGASSKVLGDYTQRQCGTIHRQLNYNPMNGDNPFGYNENNKLSQDIVIIDEFSMVDIFLFNHVIDAIDTTKTKLLMVFDPYQLPSVSCGNIAQDMLSSKEVTTNILTKIFRYSEGGLMQVATKIRNSERFLNNDTEGNKIFGSKKDFVYSEVYQDYIDKQVVKVYSKLLKDGYGLQDIMVLSSQNKGNVGTKEINKKIQYIIHKNRDDKFVMRGETKFYLGDKVIQIINNYKAQNINGEESQIFNGNTGVIVAVRYNEIDVEFDECTLTYTKEDLNQLELGFCITIHKSQGSSAKQIILISPKAHTFMLNSNLLYVGVTRAKERVFMIGNIVTINSAIKEKENFQRNTWLVEMINSQK